MKFTSNVDCHFGFTCGPVKDLLAQVPFNSRRPMLGVMSLLVSLSLSLIVTSQGQAAVMVMVGSADVSVGTPSVTLPVTVVGGDLVTDMAGYVQVGDGGPLLGNLAGPVVTGVDYSGSIWTAAAGGFTSFYSDSPPSEIVTPQVSLSVSGETVSAAGVLFSLTVDLAGFVGMSDVGDSYVVALENLNISATTDFRQGNTPVPAMFESGLITVVAIPEPTTVSLLLIGLAGVWGVGSPCNHK